MLAGCGSDKKETKSADGTAKTAGYAKDAKLKVWGSQEDQDMLKGIIEDFKADNPEAADWSIETAVVSAADAKNEVLKDPTVAADIFEFASDQIAELQSAGALYRITKNKDKIIADNVENSVDAATIDGEMYGYPNTSNSFFMYYDKSKYTEEEVKSLDTMLAKDLGAGVTNFSMDLDNGWYSSAFFFGAGCTLFGEDGTDPKQCDFNNEKGVLVGDYLLDLCTNPKVKNQDDALLLASFKEGKLGASLTGTWNAAALKEFLGDNFGVATVPAITLEDGTEVYFNSETKFRYPVKFEESERRVFLEGEAYFKVKRDERPFSVEMGGNRIEVLGTEFNARFYPDEDKQMTTLVSGKVKFISGKDESLELSPGEQAILTSKGKLIRKSVDVNLYTAWKDGNFVFRKQRLEEVLNTLARWYDVNVFYEDVSRKEVEFTGNIKRFERFEEILYLLRMTGDTDFEVKGKNIFVKCK